MVGEVSLVTAGQLACCLTVDRVECETQNPPQSHHVVARPGVVGLLRATTIYLSTVSGAAVADVDQSDCCWAVVVVVVVNTNNVPSRQTTKYNTCQC